MKIFAKNQDAQHAVSYYNQNVFYDRVKYLFYNALDKIESKIYAKQLILVFSIFFLLVLQVPVLAATQPGSISSLEIENTKGNLKDCLVECFNQTKLVVGKNIEGSKVTQEGLESSKKCFELTLQQSFNPIATLMLEDRATHYERLCKKAPSKTANKFYDECRSQAYDKFDFGSLSLRYEKAQKNFYNNCKNIASCNACLEKQKASLPGIVNNIRGLNETARKRDFNACRREALKNDKEVKRIIQEKEQIERQRQRELERCDKLYPKVAQYRECTKDNANNFAYRIDLAQIPNDRKKWLPTHYDFTRIKHSLVSSEDKDCSREFCQYSNVFVRLWVFDGSENMQKALIGVCTEVGCDDNMLKALITNQASLKYEEVTHRHVTSLFALQPNVTSSYTAFTNTKQSQKLSLADSFEAHLTENASSHHYESSASLRLRGFYIDDKIYIIGLEFVRSSSAPYR